jgi:hypothetical protein
MSSIQVLVNLDLPVKLFQIYLIKLSYENKCFIVILLDLSLDSIRKSQTFHWTDKIKTPPGPTVYRNINGKRACRIYSGQKWRRFSLKFKMDPLFRFKGTLANQMRVTTSYGTPSASICIHFASSLSLARIIPFKEWHRPIRERHLRFYRSSFQK